MKYKLKGMDMICMFSWLTKQIVRGLGYDKIHKTTISFGELYGKGSDAVELLHELQKIGTIAGSAVSAHLLSRFIDKVGDIDLFVDTKDAFNAALDLLFDSSGIQCYVFAHEFINAQDSDPCISVVSVQHSSFKVPIQIVMHKDKNPLDLVAHFDMDYIQCGFHNGIIYTTDAFDKVRQTGQSTQFNVSHPPRAYRLSKALDKGFSVPLYGMYNSNGSPLSMTSVEQSIVRNAQKKYLSTYWENQQEYIRTTDMVSYDQLCVDRWVPVGKKMMAPFSGRGREICYRYGNFILTDDKEREYPVPAICARVVVTAYYTDRERVKLERSQIIQQLGVGAYFRLSENCERPAELNHTYNAVIELYMYNDVPCGRIVQLISCNGAIQTPTISSDFSVSYRY